MVSVPQNELNLVINYQGHTQTSVLSHHQRSLMQFFKVES